MKLRYAFSDDAPQFFLEGPSFLKRYGAEFCSDRRMLEPEAYFLFLGAHEVHISLGAHPHRSLRASFSNIKTRTQRMPGWRHELLLRAIRGRHKAWPPCVVDMTAGLGEDAYLMASQGMEVFLCERFVPLACALEYLVALAQEQGDRTALRMHVLSGDAYSSVEALRARAPLEVFYCDPMFPASEGSALPSGEKQWMREHVGPDPDADEHFLKLLEKPYSRIIVKRPKYGPPLGGRPPHHSLAGETTRFDVYERRSAD